MSQAMLRRHPADPLPGEGTMEDEARDIFADRMNG